jgi:hypothetical protein
MSDKLKTGLIVGGIIFAIAIAVVFLSLRGESQPSANNNANTEDGTVAGASTNEDNEYIVKLAQYLTQQGAVLYGAYWCPHCQDQKKLFGDAVQYINYVECDPTGQDANPDECRGQNIKSYPTWVYQGTHYTGTQSLSKLATMVGFTK